ncbi:MAG: tetratricopeptide repeat protein [candidate division Zixibacteria bacterium]|nr:tetratricopeptide repeat protein [candidate division Zixibacteria bacterium]
MINNVNTFKKYPRRVPLSLLLFLFPLGAYLFFSCSNQENLLLRYNLERDLYKAEKLRQVLFINLKSATTEDFKRVIKPYHEVVNLTSQSKPPLDKELSDLAASAQLRIAELYFLQNEFDSSIRSFQQVLKSYPQSISQNKKALLSLGRIHERRYQREKAVQVYHQLLDNYTPLLKKNIPDPEIFEIPNHLIQLYSLQEDKTKREQEFENARDYYQNLVHSYPNTQISYAATISLARAYQLQRMWKESLQILETARDTSGQIPAGVLIQIGNIYYDELRDEKKALESFSQVIDSTTDTLSMAEAQTKIGIIYFQKEDYASARRELSKVNRLYPKATSYISTAQYLIAQIYDKGGEWERALNEYNWLMVNNPLSPEGLDAPLRIVSYNQKRNPELALESSDKAVKHYDELLDKYKDKPFVPLIENQKAKLYILGKDFNNAALCWQKISEKYAGTDAGLNALLNLWRLYRLELKDEKKLKEISARIESEYPGVIQDSLLR